MTVLPLDGPLWWVTFDPGAARCARVSGYAKPAGWRRRQGGWLWFTTAPERLDEAPYRFRVIDPGPCAPWAPLAAAGLMFQGGWEPPVPERPVWWLSLTPVRVEPA
ncbi:hypothetical protein [Piscicoccus intestinalis]|uniref:hypothetical protein n=1 Tax=Piscicoccus intestinalis TaxID=746033 RepID=UPI000837E489|nr:hypothetical protein [Piscicoccus intestinalis]